VSVRLQVNAQASVQWVRTVGVQCPRTDSTVGAKYESATQLSVVKKQPEKDLFRLQIVPRVEATSVRRMMSFAEKIKKLRGYYEQLRGYYEQLRYGSASSN
jgi:hypothetical protein